MAKGQDRQGREAKKPKANKKVAPASSFLRPQPSDKPSPSQGAASAPAPKKA